MNRLLIVASSPHIRAELNTRQIMGWVLVALAPAGAAGVYFFGARVLALVAACVATCVATEAVWQKTSGYPLAINDLSAVVTGVLLVYNLPPAIPIWMACCSSAFAMIVVKHFFGGLGCNIVNPALAGRAMMLICWPVAMTTWTLNGVTGPTPLSIIKDSAAAGTDVLPAFTDLLVGNVGGCIGETSAVALILGGAILLAKDIISWRIPVVYIATVAVITAVLGRPAGAVYEIFAGGLMLGAIFMATDYATSPITPKGQIAFAVGCGLITSLIRSYGGYPEGVSYSILIMNLAVPVIDRLTAPHILGEAKKSGNK